MKHRVSVSLLALGLLTIGLSSLQADVNTPAAQYFWDAPTHSIRAIWGYGGTARIGPAVLQGLDFATVAPGGRQALVQRAAHGRARSTGEFSWVNHLDRETPEEHYLGGIVSSHDLATWSGDGGCVALYSAADRMAQRICASDAGAQIRESMAFGAEDTITALALNRDGSMFAALVNGEIQISSASFGVQRIGDLGSPQAIAFSAHGDSLLIADERVGLRELSLPGRELVALLPAEEIGGGASLVFEAAKTGIVYVTGATALIAYSRETGSVIRRESPDFAMTGMHALGSTTFLSSRSSSEEALQLIDISRQELLFFVPPTR